jgi:FkbM family methyltransferase
MLYHPKHKIWYEPDTDHLDMVYQARREFKALRSLVTEDDTVLDIGAHIGSFSCDLPAHCIVCVEPIPQTYQVLYRNFSYLEPVSPSGSHNLVNAAIVPDTHEGDTVPIYLAPKRSSASPSIVPFRGRTPIEVIAVRWSSILEFHPPTIIKCDAESVELFLDWSKVPPQTRGIAMELHYSRPEFRDMARQVLSTLTSLGFEPISGRFNADGKYPGSNFVAIRRTAFD